MELQSVYSSNYRQSHSMEGLDVQSIRRAFNISESKQIVIEQAKVASASEMGALNALKSHQPVPVAAAAAAFRFSSQNDLPPNMPLSHIDQDGNNCELIPIEWLSHSPNQTVMPQPSGPKRFKADPDCSTIDNNYSSLLEPSTSTSIMPNPTPNGIYLSLLADLAIQQTQTHRPNRKYELEPAFQLKSDNSSHLVDTPPVSNEILVGSGVPRCTTPQMQSTSSAEAQARNIPVCSSSTSAFWTSTTSPSKISGHGHERSAAATDTTYLLEPITPFKQQMATADSQTMMIGNVQSNCRLKPAGPGPLYLPSLLNQFARLPASNVNRDVDRASPGTAAAHVIMQVHADRMQKQKALEGICHRRAPPVKGSARTRGLAAHAVKNTWWRDKRSKPKGGMAGGSILQQHISPSNVQHNSCVPIPQVHRRKQNVRDLVSNNDGLALSEWNLMTDHDAEPIAEWLALRLDQIIDTVMQEARVQSDQLRLEKEQKQKQAATCSASGSSFTDLDQIIAQVMKESSNTQQMGCSQSLNSSSDSSCLDIDEVIASVMQQAAQAECSSSVKTEAMDLGALDDIIDRVMVKADQMQLTLQTKAVPKATPKLKKEPHSRRLSIKTKGVKVKPKCEKVVAGQTCARVRPLPSTEVCARVCCPYDKHRKGNMRFYFMHHPVRAKRYRPRVCTKFDQWQQQQGQRQRPLPSISPSLPLEMQYSRFVRGARVALTLAKLVEEGDVRSSIHGVGVFAAQSVEAGTLLVEYCGEIIRNSLCDVREAQYKKRGLGTYMFRLDNDITIDATLNASAARFVNHSCVPNCAAKTIVYKNNKKIILYSSKFIMPGEELSYNYKLPYEKEKIPCLCNHPNCKKYLN